MRVLMLRVLSDVDLVRQYREAAAKVQAEPSLDNPFNSTHEVRRQYGQEIKNRGLKLEDFPEEDQSIGA